MTALTILVIWALGWVWFATALAFQDKTAAPEKAEAIVVLTGGNGRVNAGLNLLADKIAPKLFISGVNAGTTKSDIFDTWKTPKSPKPCCIDLGYKAEDTSGNAVEVHEWIQENKITSIILVTSQYHMPRAYLEISHILPNLEITRYSVESYDFTPWEGRFWSLTFSEYNKTLIQLLRFTAR